MKLHAVALREKLFVVLSTMQQSLVPSYIEQSLVSSFMEQGINVEQNISGAFPFIWVNATWVDAEWANNRVEELLLKKEVKGANQKLRLQLID